ncbi:arylsulfatase B-like isoform X1 [Oratosquilla oratoria]|uniref:arylsulfatase B-like isoform X1 n=1 Tax=Oratosquilla oratoria TaxID=337810 RepID=UPI003F7573BA
MDQVMKSTTFLILSWLLVGLNAANPSPPNIIIIVADDLGWNDVGFHGSTQIPTPNIDALAYSGVILNNYYVQPICTPSRSALMTGKHPIHTGLQSNVIYGPQPYGISLGETLLPQYLQNLGYLTFHVGKWHLGMAIKELTPLHRGFLSHYGYWTGHQDYYDHTSQEAPGYWGYDMRRNMSVARDAYGKYTTDLFTEEAVHVITQHNTSAPLFLYLAHLAVHSANPYAPLQAPAEVVKKFSYIENEHRRKFAGMLWKLDESVGAVVGALKEKNMLDNSIILFTTDNGGPAEGFNQNAASNWPLRGVKSGLWEGGVRGAGFIWSPLLKRPGRVYNSMMHITDILPTLVSAAGGNSQALGSIDGMDMWNSLVNDKISPRIEFLINIDPMLGGAAIRVGDWKLVYRPMGSDLRWNGWYGPSGRNETAKETKLENIFYQILESPAADAVKTVIPKAFKNILETRKAAEVLCGPVPSDATKSCQDPTSPCLFHIPTDPCEYHDLSEDHSDIMNVLHGFLEKYNATAVPPRNKPFDKAANPKYWGYTWTNWRDYPSPIGLKMEENLDLEVQHVDGVY